MHIFRVLYEYVAKITRMDVAYVVGVNFGNVKSSRILTSSDASWRYLVSITFTAYVSEYSSYQWLPEGKNKIAYTVLFTMFALLFFFGEYMYCIYRINSYQSFFFNITDISRYRQLIRSTWMHPCVVGVRVAHICFSFFLFVSSRSLCYFCSTV